MTPAKEDVKKWLNEIGKDRFWLADKCSTGKRAVDKWFEKKGEIPAKAILVMQELMRAHPSAITQELESASADANEEEQEIVLAFTDDEWSIIQDFRKAYPNKNIEDYCRDKALEFCLGMTNTADTNPVKSTGVRRDDVFFGERQEFPRKGTGDPDTLLAPQGQDSLPD